MRIKFKFTHKYYGFLKKHTKMWWRTVKKELVKNGIHPQVLYIGSSGVIEWSIKECPLIRFGAWMTERTDKFVLFADWEDAIDKFKPSRCPFNFSNVDEMIKEAIKMAEIYKEGGKTLNDYILKNNSYYITDNDRDMIAFLKNEHEMYRCNGMTQEKWDKAFCDRNVMIQEAVADKNVWGVVLVPDMESFNNIPEILFVAIEDEEDKITDEEFNKAVDKWQKHKDSACFDSNFNMEVVTKYELFKYANSDKRTRRRFSSAGWRKGKFVKIKNKR